MFSQFFGLSINFAKMFETNQQVCFFKKVFFFSKFKIFIFYFFETAADMVVVWLSGLRGAIAFSLALGKETTNGEVFKNSNNLNLKF